MLSIIQTDRKDAPAFVFDMMEPERPKVRRYWISSKAQRLIRRILSFAPTAFAGSIRRWRVWSWQGVGHPQA
jgi:hypothetical protein